VLPTLKKILSFVTDLTGLGPELAPIVACCSPSKRSFAEKNNPENKEKDESPKKTKKLKDKKKTLFHRNFFRKIYRFF